MDAGTRAAIRAMPKIELHRHLEGSVRLSTLVDIARQYRLPFGPASEENLRPLVQMTDKDPRSAAGFLSKFRALREFYRSPEIIQRIARESIEDASADNIRYMELRFTPKALCNLTEISFADAVALVCDAANDAAQEYGIMVRYIVSINRHEPVELGTRALQAAITHQDKGITGFDLAGDETNYPATLFYKVFQQAKAAGFGITVHAGEWAGAISVWDAVGNLLADRVGHGINILRDEALLPILVERGTVLEVCPLSNVLSGVVDSLGEHPLRALTEKGVQTTINTDDPSVCDVTLTDEISLAIENGQMALADVADYTLRAAKAAFLPDDERQALVAQFRDWYNQLD